MIVARHGAVCSAKNSGKQAACTSRNNSNRNSHNTIVTVRRIRIAIIVIRRRILVVMIAVIIEIAILSIHGTPKKLEALLKHYGDVREP